VLRSLVLTAAAVALTFGTGSPTASAAERPLVYVFVLDGLDGDRVDLGQAPFLSELLQGGGDHRATYWRESRSIMVAETNPNHVAMATGAYADRSGIPGNAFAVYGTPDIDDGCPTGPIDESKPPTSTDGKSPLCLQAETFFQSIQRSAASEPLVTAGIFGKPKLAQAFASKTGDRYDADYLWTPCLDRPEDQPFCKQVLNRPNDEYALLDRTVMDEVMRTVRDGVAGDGKTFGGAGKRPDLTFVNFPGIDSSGHGTGTMTGEYQNAIGRVSGELARFVAQQKELGLWARTVMLVVSDHSMETTSGRTTLDQRFSEAGVPRDAYTIVGNGSASLVYLNDRTSPGRFELLKQLRSAAIGGEDGAASLRGGPAAVEALYREPNPLDGMDAFTLAARHPAWRLLGPRTGDLVVTAQTGVAFNDPIGGAPFNPLPGNHGAPQTRDNFMALIGPGSLVVQQGLGAASDPLFDDTLRNPGQSENVDVAPTAMRLLGLPAPKDSQGRVLDEALVPGGLPALGSPSGPPTGTAGPPNACAADAEARASAKAAGRGLRVAVGSLAGARADVDIFRQNAGTRILGGRGGRRVASFRQKRLPVSWNGAGRGVGDGIYVVRVRLSGGDRIERRIAVVRRRGRFARRPPVVSESACGLVGSLSLGRAVFGGRRRTPLTVSYRLAVRAKVRVELRRRGRLVRVLERATRAGGAVHRERVSPAGLRRGDHQVRVLATAGGRTTTVTVTAARL